ncbi:hypothetical protein J5N97_017135 [Dioscorea zingiberensis]|uniref:Glutathione hydrolase n=1 Tax=Dioscorea zingiberensis TaxID=325984 RepID=A0A9D5CL76_9LILI|nr:hypothetical protein J5N97_017135 [Dioscorea zingiberensis]
MLSTPSPCVSSLHPQFTFSTPKSRHLLLLIRVPIDPIRAVAQVPSPPKKKKKEPRNADGESEAAELVRTLLRKANADDEKRPLVSTLNKHVRILRTEHCFLLFEELGRRDRWLQCLEVFRWMQKQRWYIADNGIYSKLISVMGKKGQTRMAMWLFSEMRSSGCRPDTSVYNALITAHLHSKDKTKALAKAMGYFEKMKGDVKKVDELFKDLKASAVSPDIYTYNGVMDAYGKNKMVAEMESVLQLMKTNQCKPDVITFNLLIDSYAEADQLLYHALRKGLVPNASTYKLLFKAYTKASMEGATWSIKTGMDLQDSSDVFAMGVKKDITGGKVQQSQAIAITLFFALQTVLSIARPEEITAAHGVVATDVGTCSRIGRDVLREGGHAVDAVVAAALCLGVVSLASSGIGGGAFMLLRLANGDAQAFDMRETAPFSSSMNMYAGNATLKTSGALSIAVPGEVAGLHEAWKQHGKLPWKRLVMPATRLARRGFRISPYLFMQMNKNMAGILADEGLSNMLTSKGKLLQPGDTCYNKRLARTLRAISKHGPQILYDGSVGKDLVRDIQKFGGILTIKDLQKYKVRVTEPISAEIMGLKILGMPPPSAGGAGIILMLNILARYGIPSGVSGSLGIHRFIESLKNVFAVRMNLGDPEFVNVSEVLSDMLSPKFAEALRERNAVSMTTSVNSYFGALYQSPSTGILLNNEMDDFSIPENVSSNAPPPAPANFISPSKRPLSTMAPTIVLKDVTSLVDLQDGQLRALVGASGGAMIIAAITEVLMNHFGKGMDPLSSILAPRSYHQLIPNVLQYENWTTVTGDHFEVPAETRIALKKKGHVLLGLAGGTITQFVVHKLEDSQAVEGVVYGKLIAISDPRKGGLPAGY